MRTGIALAALTAVALALAAPVEARTSRLPAFASCAQLVAYAQAHATRPAPLPAGRPGATDGSAEAQPVAAPATGALPDDVSQTNVQEAGVDEPDLVKTDGTRLYAVAGGRLHVIDARAARPAELASLELEPGADHQLLLHGGRLLIVSQAFGGFVGPLPPGGDVAVPAVGAPIFGAQKVRLTEVDVRDPRAPRVTRSLELEGRYVDARLNGRTARIVLSTFPRALEPPTADPPGAAAFDDARAWRPEAVLTNRRTGRSTTRPALPCRAIRRPPVFSGTDVLTILTVDLTRGLPAVDADAVMTSADKVYASSDSLYVATERWIDPADPPERFAPGRATRIHRFDIADPDRTVYRASGDVRGHLLNQFSMSEHAGVLRVASTDVPTWFATGDPRTESESFVTVLEERGGALAEVGRVGGLGRGERIYAVRFVGDVGYVVTFRQVDPLYTLDLARPREPRVAGELKILGYSAYLHPVGDGLLLGVGQDATEEGRRRGAQVSLFDVSDPARPSRLDQRGLGEISTSAVEYDHHAFTYWPRERLAIVPVQAYTERAEAGAVGLRVDRARGLTDVGRVTHEGTGGAEILRSTVVGRRVFTLSQLGMLASSLQSLEPAGWIPFAQPAAPG